MSTENELFDKIDFTSAKLTKGEYENCIFKNCNFYNSDLSGFIFRECIFDGCDLSLVIIKHTTLHDISFLNSKLLGIQFHECNSFLFSVTFNNCILKMSVFFKLKLKKYKFTNCNLQEADFTESDLTSSLFDNCDLQRTIFYNTNLEKADFSTSYNYSFDPERNRIKKARFSKSGVIGLLAKYNIEIE
jgi:fluoroquinolone resistance protein